MDKKSKRNPLRLHRDTLIALQAFSLKEAVGGLTPKCPDTQTGIVSPKCIC